MKKAREVKSDPKAHKELAAALKCEPRSSQVHSPCSQALSVHSAPGTGLCAWLTHLSPAVTTNQISDLVT